MRGSGPSGARLRGSGPSAPGPLDSLAPTPWSATNQLTNKPAQPAQPARPAQHLPSSPISFFRGQQPAICESSYSKEKTRSEDEKLRPGLLWKRRDPLDRSARKWLTYRRILSKASKFQERKRGDRLALAETLRKQSCSIVDEIQRQAS